MFDFEKLLVYKKAKSLNQNILKFLKMQKALDYFLKDQLKRASISIVINIAEGSGRFTKPDKRNFYVIARASTYECVSLLDIMKSKEYISVSEFEDWYKQFEEISKMLLSLITYQSK